MAQTFLSARNSGFVAALTEFYLLILNTLHESVILRVIRLFYVVMVFVFHQMLVSALLYLSNKLKALALNVSGEERRRGLYLTDETQVSVSCYTGGHVLPQPFPSFLFTIHVFIDLSRFFSPKSCANVLFAFFANLNCLQVTL